MVPAIMGSTYLLGGVASFSYAIYRYELRLQRVAWRELLHMIHEGKEIFLGNISVSLSRDFNILILGAVGVPAHSLSAYSVAEKFTKSLQAVARPLNQLFFPIAVRAIRNEREPSVAVAKTIFQLTLPQLGAVALMLTALAVTYRTTGKNIAAVASFPNRDEIVSYLCVMAPGVFFGIASFMFGGVGLNYLKCRAYYFRVILFVGISSASTCYLLSHWIGAAAAVYCYLGSEILTALLVIHRFMVNPGFLEKQNG